jgi:HEAT repeat protein
MTKRLFAKIGFFIFIIAAAALAYCAHAQTPSIQAFFQTLVDHYDPASMPTEENFMRVIHQIDGARPEEITKALPAIFAALAHPDETVKHLAGTALFGIARRPDGAALLKSHINDMGRVLLTSPNPETRAGLELILGTLNPAPPEVLPVFLAFLKQTDADVQAQQGGVIFHLVQIVPDNPEVIAAVQEFLSRPLDSQNRIGTLNALGNPAIKDSRIIAAVTASLDDPDPGVRSTAIQSLGRIGPQALQQAEPMLQRLAADNNQPADVTATAKEALQRIHPPPK